MTTPAPRKGLPKRLRYEILRRDGYTCRYCGASAPDVKLTVDHVVPPMCSAGYLSRRISSRLASIATPASHPRIPPPLLDDVAQRALDWAAAIQRVAEQRAIETEYRRAVFDLFDAEWHQWTTDSPDGVKLSVPRDANWRESLLMWISRGLDEAEICDGISTAMSARPGRRGIPSKDVWRYFCGIMWNNVRELEATALAIIEADETPFEDFEEAECPAPTPEY